MSHFSSEKKSIPITLISGFLGSGKTTLLENILTANHGLRVAVVINDISSLNIDAELIKNHKVTNKEEKLIQLQNGCICCTLRGDLLEELVSFAESGDVQYIVIESTGISEPMQVAETFSQEFSEQLLEFDELEDNERAIIKKVTDVGGLNKITHLDTCVTMVDALNFYSNLETTEFLADRWGSTGQDEENRTITDLMVDQIEFSDIILLNKISSVNKKRIKKITGIIKALNPVAKIITCDYAKVDINQVLNSGLFDYDKVSTSAGWLQSIHNMTVVEGYGNKGKKTLAPKPETEEYGITNFIYKARRPFHPQRLYSLIKDYFIMIERTPNFDQEGAEKYEESSDGESTNSNEDGTTLSEDESAPSDKNEEEGANDLTDDQVIQNKRNSMFGTIIRSKGFFWLATRYIIRGEWSSAGTMLTLSGGVPWFAISKDLQDLEIPQEALNLIEKDMEGPYGDRRNEIVFIGVNMDVNKITKALDSCLLNSKEYKEFEETIGTTSNLYKVEKRLQEKFEDGFEDWMLYGDENEDEEAELKIPQNHHHPHSHHQSVGVHA